MIVGLLATKTNQLVDGQSIADLWPKIVEEEGIEVEFNHEITDVFKDWNGKIVVETCKGDREGFDFLIWSGLLSEFEKVADVISRQNLQFKGSFIIKSTFRQVYCFHGPRSTSNPPRQCMWLRPSSI